MDVKELANKINVNPQDIIVNTKPNGKIEVATKGDFQLSEKQQEIIKDINNPTRRIEKLEKANGVGRGGERGIAGRIDELEDRIEKLEQ